MCGQTKANTDLRGKKSSAELRKERGRECGTQAIALLSMDNAARCYCSDCIIFTRAPIDYTHLLTLK